MNTQGSRVLVLEDVPETAEWLRRRVQAAFGDGAAVTLAPTLAAARRLLAAGAAFDTVIVDLGLPDGNGVELIQQLAPAQSGITVVVATIYDDDAHIFSALRSGARGYLLKDQSDEDIERALAGIRDGVPPISPAVARRMMDFFAQHERHEPVDENLLSPREKDVLVLIANGMSVAEASASLGISVHTVRGYVKEIYRKLGISSRAEASLRATRMGLIKL